MKPPKIEKLKDIEAILTDISETEASLESLKEQLHDKVENLGEEIEDREQLLELAAYLYWMVPEIKSASIALALTGEPKVHSLKKILPSVTAEIYCDRCNAAIPFESRSKLHGTIRDLQQQKKRGIARWAEGYSIVCEDCRNEIFTERNEKYNLERAAYQKRLLELRSMPYREYLRTPEWQTRRKRHLKSAGYKCQVCNASSTRLDVHHRTYERRGEELFKDLIVLCRGCHELFHKEGKLA